MAKTITLIAKLKGAAKAKKGLKGLDGALGGIVQTAFTVGTAMKALEFVKLSGQAEALARGFNNLSKSSGFSAQALNKLRSATDGTMNSMDLMKQANNAMLLGIAESEDQMADMFDVAQRLASALGQDTAFGIESLVTGLGRQSKLMLDNLGIMVDVESANKNYAESLGKTVSELTDAERKQAFVNEAMKEANTLVKNLGDEHLTTADKIKRAQSAMDDLKVELGVMLTPIIENAARAAGLLARKLRLAIDPKSLRIDELKREIARLQAHLIQMADDPSFFDKLKNALGGDAILMERLRDYEDMLKKLQSTLSTTGNVIVSDYIGPQKESTKLTKENAIAVGESAQSVLGAVRGVIKAYFAQMMSTILLREVTSKGLFGLITASAGAAAASQLFEELVPKFAQGGSFVTSGPQMIMVGDNPGGRERVQIDPLSSSGSNAPGSGITINISGGVVQDDYIRNELIPALNKATSLGARINA